ncbi:MAG: peptidoglycan-binding protein [Rivularia sp. (in: cyanobacteria)]
MESIGYIHAASSYEAPESTEIVPFRFDFNIFAGLNQKKLPSFAAMRLLSVALTLFCLSSVGQALALEKYGSKGASVTTIQKCLKELDYFNASVTGYYGSTTKSAVIKFQKDNGLTTDGVVGSNTQKTLESKCSSRSPAPDRSGVLQLGSRGETVKKLQLSLKQLNFFVGNPSGYFGPVTKDAVIGFQKNKGLTVDGIAGSRTLAAIEQSSTKGNDAVGGENSILRLGSRGAEVTSIQKRLQQLKYFEGKLSGYYGPATRDAIVRFQKAMKLTVDGIVGPNTQQAIDKAIQQLESSSPLPLGVGACSSGKCPILQTGDKSNYVTYLQTRLRHWGYFNSNPNGNYDYQTAEAVKRFQRNKGLFADGVVGPQTWQQIDNTSPVGETKPEKCDKPVLQRGDKGECVTKLQNRLKELNYFKGNATSYFGNTTWEAVQQFQLSNELPSNGIVDSRTWKALEKANVVISDNRYVVVVPMTSPYTLDEVRRFVPDAFIRNTKLGKFVQAGEFTDSQGAKQYSQYFLRDRGFDARVIPTDKL